MTHRDNNLTQFFTEYLNIRLGRKSELTHTNITMACCSALNGIENSFNIAEVVLDMRNDLENIYKVVDDLARNINNKNKSYERNNQGKPSEHLTIPEIHSIFGISQQAIRKACTEKRLPFIEGKGKNKYLISKADAEKYMKHARRRDKEKRK